MFTARGAGDAGALYLPVTERVRTRYFNAVGALLGDDQDARAEQADVAARGLPSAFLEADLEDLAPPDPGPSSLLSPSVAEIEAWRQWIRDRFVELERTAEAPARAQTLRELIRLSLEGVEHWSNLIRFATSLVEAWRALKSGLGLRPVYHWRPWRIEAHAGLCVLALLLERVVELRVGQT